MQKTLECRVEESVLRWYGHVERMDERRVVKRVYKSEFMGRRRLGRPSRSWREYVNECIRKRGGYVTGAERMVNNRNAWRAFCKATSLMHSHELPNDDR